MYGSLSIPETQSTPSEVASKRRNSSSVGFEDLIKNYDKGTNSMGLRYLKLIHELLLPSRSQDWVGILVIKNVVVMCCSRDWIPRDNCGLNPWPGQNLMPGTTVSTQDMMG